MTLLRASAARRAPSTSSLPEGRRIYAIGDIHGSAVLFHRLIDGILSDSSGRGEERETLVVLGDFIDRGAHSATVLQSLFSQRMADNLVVLLGNHEAAMVASYRGDRRALAFWLRFGGVATLASFGVQERAIDTADLDATMRLLRRSVPSVLIDWMAGLPLTYRAGDYLFVHAGIRPGVPLRRQKATDFLWIRDEFLNSDRDHGIVVVHGHSPTAQVDFRPNRICVDTGAYESGVLSALGLEKDQHWVVDTR